MILRSRTLYNILIIFDLAIMGVAAALATAMHFNLEGRVSFNSVLFNIRVRFTVIIFLLAFMALWHLLLRIFGAYRDERLHSHKREALGLICAMVAGSALLYLGGQAMKSTVTDFTFILVFFSINCVLVLSAHFVIRYFFGQVWAHSHLLRRFVFPAYRDNTRPVQRREALILCSLVVIATMALLLVARQFHFVEVDVSGLLVFFTLVILAVIAGNSATQVFFEKNGRRGMARHLVIAGTNRRALALSRYFSSHPELGYRVIGFVDDVIIAPELHSTAMPLTRETAKSLAFADADLIDAEKNEPLLTNFDNFASFIRKQVVDEVILCLPVLSFYKQSSRIVSLCRDHGVTVNYASDLFDLKRSHSTDMEIINIYTGLLYTKPSAATIKRLTDIAVSFAGLLALLPFFLVIAFLIKITSRGPVFFSQTRIGWNKRKFKLYKFRTMITGAEEKVEELAHLNVMDGPILKIPNDPRITRIGRWLRRLSLDELPQLINVLIGDMSLVGPRPLTLRDFQGFEIDWHHRRFSVRPGITCFWQVQGRNAIPFDKWMELDARYVDTWSIRTDIDILLRTLPAVLKGKGAI